jgi:hypothetical protein
LTSSSTEGIGERERADRIAESVVETDQLGAERASEAGELRPEFGFMRQEVWLVGGQRHFAHTVRAHE